jgi:peptidyl-prolyl cis-trans isomerase B (cyclophilin B)
MKPTMASEAETNPMSNRDSWRQAVRNSLSIVAMASALFLALVAGSPAAVVAQEGENPPGTSAAPESAAAEAARENRWNRYRDIGRDLQGGRLGPEEALEDYQRLLTTVARGTELEPYVLYSLMGVCFFLEDTEGASKWLTELQSKHPDHYLNTRRMSALRDLDEQTGSTTTHYASQVLEHQRQWLSGAGRRWTEPEPTPTPKVVLETDEGNITLVFYPDVAPRHVENFLKLVREGYYDGTTFHRIDLGIRILGGDPNTRKGAKASPDDIGKGGPGYELEPCPGLVRNRRGALTAKYIDRLGVDHGSQYFINVGSPLSQDTRWTVFGRVESGMEVVDRIASRPVDELWRPLQPVAVRTARVIP